jgi:hypothetical protein
VPKLLQHTSSYRFASTSGRETINAAKHLAAALRTFQLASSSSVYSFALSLQNSKGIDKINNKFKKYIDMSYRYAFFKTYSSSSSSRLSSSVSSSMLSVKFGS